MRILQIRAHEGPNVFADFPVLRMTLDLEELRDTHSAVLPRFVEALLRCLPGLAQHRCSRNHVGGFVERLREGTYFGHIVEHVALQLSGPAGIEVGYGKTVYGGAPGIYDVVVEYEDPKAMSVLLEAAVALCLALLSDQPFDVAVEVDRARQIAEGRRLGPSTAAIAKAATRRGIPWTRLNGQSLLVLGHGVHRRFVQATITSETRHLAVELASDKQLTKQVLGHLGLPVPAGQVVSSEDAAVAAFRALGTSVVVKPLDANQGRGVSLALETDAQVREAFRIAKAVRERVLLEAHVPGRNFRALVVNDALVAASERFPAQVTGDGAHSLAELVATENQNPLRGADHSSALSPIALDEIVIAHLAKTGHTLDDVPAAGERVELRDSVNLSTGGTAVDVTEQLHPEIAAACRRAARGIGLDVCGVDFVCQDLDRPLTGQGAIIELNAAPGIRMHEHPSAGQPRSAGEAIVGSLFPRHESGRIPIIAVTGTNGKTTTTRMIAHVFRPSRCVGMTSTAGVFVDGACAQPGDMTGPSAARMVLFDPTVELAVLETARGGIVRRGLGYDWADVGVLTNIQLDHIGQDGIESLGDLYRIKRLVAERVRVGGTLILNAEDARLSTLPKDEVVRRIERRIVFFALDPQNAVLREHLRTGGTGYAVHNGTIVELQGSIGRPIVRVDDVPSTLGGRASFAIANALAACAACRAQGASLEEIRTGLQTFSGPRDNPGRLNAYRVRGGHAVVDYGHNLGAYTEAGALARALRTSRATAVMSVPGDRPDALANAVARVVAAAFDRILVKDDCDRRGRAPLEMPQLIAATIRRERPACICEVWPEEQQAVERALAGMVHGEIVFIFTDDARATCTTLSRHGAEPTERLDSEASSIRLVG